MARGDFLPGVVLPTNGLNDAVLSACHPLAPVISIVVRTLSAACVDGWIPANHLTPGVVLHATGTLAGLLRLTPAKVGEVLDAMDATGLLATGSDGTRRMADHDVIIGAVSDSNVRYARRVSRGKTRAKENNKLDGVCLTKREHCLPHEKTTEDNGATMEDIATVTPGHDAHAGSSTDILVRHFQPEPSAPGIKNNLSLSLTNIEQQVQVIDEEPKRIEAPQLRLVADEPSDPRQRLIDRACTEWGTAEETLEWRILGAVMNERWMLANHRLFVWDMPGFDPIVFSERIAHDCGPGINLEEFKRAAAWLEDNHRTKPKRQLGAFLRNWMVRSASVPAMGVGR